MTWTKKFMTTMETREMRLDKLPAGDRRAIADADQAGQLDISRKAKGSRSLRTPTDVARMADKATHVPFRDWCPICVASRGRSSPHRRVVVNKTADTLPKLQTTCSFEQWQRAKFTHVSRS